MPPSGHPSLDRALIAKLLTLTGSQTDAEALSAIRKANDLLHDARLTWADLLLRPAADIPAAAPMPPETVSHAGLSLEPPVGSRWLDTARWLVHHQAGRDAAESLFLVRAMRGTAQGQIPAFHDAALLVAIYRAYAQPGQEDAA